MAKDYVDVMGRVPFRWNIDKRGIGGHVDLPGDFEAHVSLYGVPGDDDGYWGYHMEDADGHRVGESANILQARRSAHRNYQELGRESSMTRDQAFAAAAGWIVRDALGFMG